jgi:DNA-binding transcriptional MerR regulator
VYKIKEVSEKTGISAYTLRYYEKEGILPSIERDKSGQRVYSDENIAWLEIVVCLKDTNMPLEEIKEIVRLSMIGDETIDERKQILLEHRKKIQNQIEILKKSMAKVDKKIAFYDGAETC